MLRRQRNCLTMTRSSSSSILKGSISFSPSNNLINLLSLSTFCSASNKSALRYIGSTNDTYDMMIGISPETIKTNKASITHEVPNKTKEEYTTRHQFDSSSTTDAAAADEQQQQQQVGELPEQQEQDQQQQQQAFLPPIITPDRMIVIRHLLEGRDPAGVPPQKFNGYFEDPNSVPGSYEVTIKELENIVVELFSHRTTDELNLPPDESDWTFEASSSPPTADANNNNSNNNKTTSTANQQEQNVATNKNDEITASDDINALQAQSFNAVIQAQKEQQRKQLSKIAGRQAHNDDTTTPAVSSMESPQQKHLVMNAARQREEDERYLHHGEEGRPSAPAEFDYALPDEEQVLTPHPSTRSDIVSDSVERRLLLSYAVFKYNYMIEPPGATEPVDRTANPTLYMKLAAGGIGYTIARNILQDILINEQPMHPEVLRYLVELALVLKDDQMLFETFKFAEGEYCDPELRKWFLDKAMKEEPGVFETQRDLCYTMIMTSCGEFIFKNCMICVLEGEGEGDAVRATFESIKSIVPRLPKHMQEPFLRHLDDQVQLMFQDAMERRTQIMESGGFDGNLDYGTGKLRDIEVDYLESSAETIVQAAAAVMKALVGTEVATVVDKTCSLHFELSCSLYGHLRGLGRTSEACGIAEETMRFYDNNKDKLKLENERRHKQRNEMKAEERQQQGLLGEGGETNNEDDDGNINNAMMMNQQQQHNNNATSYHEYFQNEEARYDKRETEKARRHRERQRAVSLEFNNDDPSIENDSFEYMYRNVFYHYLTDRARTDPKSGLTNILDACEKHPKSSEMFRLLTLCLFRLDRWDDALKAVDRSILLNPVNPHCHKLRAHVLYKLKEYLTAERENHLSNILHDCWEGLRPPLAPQDVLHATGALLVEADRRHQELKKEIFKDHNGDPKNKPQMPASMENALQLTQLTDPESGALISPDATALLTELVNIQLPDTDEELRFYLDQMRRHHIYSKQGPKTQRLKDVRVSDLFDLISSEYKELGIKTIDKDHFDEIGRA